MSSGPFAWVFGFISDPRFGVPFLVLVEATLIWVYWNPRTLANLGARRRSWERPEGDAVSRMYYALGDERFSVVVRWSRQRIEELFEARTGSPVPGLTFFSPEYPDLPIAVPEVRRLVRELSAFEWEAREREAGHHLRWAFWRSRGREAARYRARLDGLLDRAQGQIRTLEGRAA